VASLYTFYGIDGKRLATYQATVNDDLTYSFNLQTSNVYFGGSLIQSNGVWVSADRLGSVRANSNGEKFAYYPYGVERTSTPDGREKFGTYFRDQAGKDYADQRYYNPQYGRFWSPDPSAMGSANPKIPQSWNLYTYSLNDPVNLSDPTGLGCYWAEVPYGEPYLVCNGGSGGGVGGDGPRGPQPLQDRPDFSGGEPGHSGVGKSPLQPFAEDMALSAADVIDTGCNGLFPHGILTGDQMRAAVDNNQIRVVPFGDNIPPGVGAETNNAVNAIYIASNRYFFTGILADGSSALNTVDFSGLTVGQMQETILIHELLHLTGLAGDDSAGQQIRMPNGEVVNGSTGITTTIKEDCFGVH
jgi:RHS repeat-associated protein